jgi:hypothetical protein
MTHTVRKFLALLCLSIATTAYGAPAAGKPTLPPWQVLEFEERAFWATAKSRLELQPAPGDEGLWEFNVFSSVVGNSEEMTLDFDPADGSTLKRVRLSKGKKGKEQRLKTFDYTPEGIVRERRDPGDNPAGAPEEWPLASRMTLDYPESAGEMVVTNPHLLILLAQRLQAQGPGASQEVLVHTDRNFYRVRLTSGNGIPIDASYGVSGDSTFKGKRDTLAVALQVDPEGKLEEEPDFSVLGLSGDIILFFDKVTGLPLQVRGTAPRIGDTDINLKSVTMRHTDR